MKTRYRAAGYAAKRTAGKRADYLTVTRRGVAVGVVAVGMFPGGRTAKAEVIVTRFWRRELRRVREVDDFDS